MGYYYSAGCAFACFVTFHCEDLPCDLSIGLVSTAALTMGDESEGPNPESRGVCCSSAQKDNGERLPVCEERGIASLSIETGKGVVTSGKIHLSYWINQAAEAPANSYQILPYGC